MQTISRRSSARPNLDEPLTPSEVSVGAPVSTRLRYIPGLDGLRAIAVTAVLLYHADISWMPGGFLGVDVFFVISGYLITTLLLTEQRSRGTVRIGQFYVRRARRLLPALCLVLATVSLFTVVFLPDEIRSLRADVIAALGYATNWWQIVQHQSYVAAQGRPPMLRHLWSLAVEEQFYLLWPLILFGMFKLWKGRRLPMLIAVGAGIAISFTEMVLFSLGHNYAIADPSRVYYGSDTHAFTILLGAALAMVWSPSKLNADVPKDGRTALDAIGGGALIGLVLIFMTAHYQSNVLFRGGFLVVALLSAVAIAIAVHPASRLSAAVLGRRPMRWIGERSYGIYLWHWPIFMITRPDQDIPVAGFANVALRFGLTIVVAEMSYRWVEEPIRHGALGRWFAGLRAAGPGDRSEMWQRTIAVGAVVTAIVALTSVGLASGQSPRLEAGLKFLNAADPTTTTTTTTTTPGAAPTAPTQPAPPPQVTAVGDSVMRGAQGALQAKIPGIHVDAVVSRQFGNAIDIIRALKTAGQLSPVVVIHLGTNGVITDGHMEALKALLSDRQRVIFLNLRVPRSWEAGDNEVIQRWVPQFGNAVLINWNGEGSLHPEYFYSDRIHVNTDGQLHYADLVAAQINP